MQRLESPYNSSERRFARSPMIFVGETRSQKMIERINSLGWGRMWTLGKPDTRTPWAFDNGAYLAWDRMTPMKEHQFPATKFAARLDVALSVATRPYLAVVPDLIAGGMDSLAFSLDARSKLPNGFRWYLAIQDGMTIEEVAKVSSHFGGIFLGGTDAFKLDAGRWCNAAHGWGLPFHYGRCGTIYKLNHALRIGVDSLDSSFPLWTVGRFDHFARESMGASRQLSLIQTDYGF